MSVGISFLLNIEEKDIIKVVIHYLCVKIEYLVKMTQNRILVVDDEQTLCDALKLNLELEGYEVDTAGSAEEALAFDLSKYSLVLLDVMMGEISGFKMAKIMKNNLQLSKIPIIFCTAKDSEDDMISGLNLGADDYITKPYSIRNVIARVKTVLRRMSNNSDNGQKGIISYDGLIVNPELKMCDVDGVSVRLPRKEFEILYMLLSNKGRIFTREEIIRTVWPEEIVVLERVVDVNITRIRTKIGKYGKFIVTRSGYGYGFQP